MLHKLTKIGAGIAVIALIFVFPLGASAQVTTIAATTITSDLALGSRGSQVSALQTFLATDPSVYPSGAVTGYFGPLTQQAVRAFQTKYGLPPVGRVGPQTRAKINALMSGTGTGTVGTTTGTSPAISNVAVALNSSASTSTSTITSTATSTATSTTASTTPTIATTTNTIRGATISWTTDRPTSGKVHYSPIPLVFTENSSSNSEPFISGSVVTDPALSSSKQINLNNLSASTTYYYMVEAIDANGNVSVTWPATFQSQ